jgi:hypothetical protein
MREDEDQHAEMIHFLRNNTQLSRFSRAEVRDLIERLAADGYEIMPMAKPVEEPPPLPEDPEEHAAVIDV